jgi:nitroimidazol reductase NimA-like FMN-containing flavoprotein (pyridoxamine 5'-phosphate oxidase superfamily)
MSELFLRTPRTQVRRLPQRGAYDRQTAYAILDEGLVCSLGFVHEGQPYVIPTGYGRQGDFLYVHGSAASRMLRTIEQGVPVCVSVTLLDGLVLARSAFHHSMNYRSVVVLGTAEKITGDDEKLRALRAIVDHLLPGRWEEVRPPNDNELLATSVLRVPLEEASAKVRTGPPLDDEEDMGLSCWAGVIPMTLTPGSPLDDPTLAPGILPSAAVGSYRRPR